MSGSYVDTSALAKWYLDEPGADEFAAFMQTTPQVLTSRLVLVEMRCLLARRRRAGDLSRNEEQATYSLFTDQVAQGHISVRPVPDALFASARELTDRLAVIALRTLDALHLAAALAADARELATADRVMGDAAQALGLRLRYFGAPDG
jgi:predicted nucleic acid-binding protein